MTRRKRAAALVAILLVVTLTANAFLLPGLPVIDESNLIQNAIQNGHMISQIGHMISQIALQNEQKTTLNKTFDHWLKHATIINNMMVKYGVLSPEWRMMQAADTYQTTGAWTQAANTGSGARVGWAVATRQALEYVGGLAKIPGGQRARRAIEFATIELQDGAGIHALETIGRIRRVGPRQDVALQELDQDVLTDNPDMHTQAAQLNKGNALALVQAKQLSDMNKLLVTNTELQLVQLKAMRDAQAYALEIEVAIRERGAARLEEFNSNGSETIRAWRLP